MRRGPLCTILFLLLLCPAAGARTAAAGRARQVVLLVQSYNREYVWCHHIEKGLRMALKDLPTTLRVVYLDSRRAQDPEELRRRVAQVAELVRTLRPRVVIAADDAAQRHLVAPRLLGPDGPQVIFCGVNAPPARYGYPAANVSGVRERWHFRQSFALLRRILPKARTVILLTDGSESSTFVLRDLTAEIEAGDLPLRLKAVLQLHTVAQWRAAVLDAQKNADALAIGTYFSLRDENTGEVVPPERVMAWNRAHIHKPTIGFADYARDDGTLCGIIESGEEQGFLAGEMARRVIERDEPAGAQPMRVNQKGLVLLNLRTAQRLNLLIPYEIIKAAGVLVQ